MSIFSSNPSTQLALSCHQQPLTITKYTMMPFDEHFDRPSNPRWKTARPMHTLEPVSPLASYQKHDTVGTHLSTTLEYEDPFHNALGPETWGIFYFPTASSPMLSPRPLDVVLPLPSSSTDSAPPSSSRSKLPASMSGTSSSDKNGSMAPSKRKRKQGVNEGGRGKRRRVESDRQSEYSSGMPRSWANSEAPRLTTSKSEVHEKKDDLHPDTHPTHANGRRTGPSKRRPPSTEKPRSPCLVHGCTATFNRTRDAERHVLTTDIHQTLRESAEWPVFKARLTAALSSLGLIWCEICHRGIRRDTLENHQTSQRHVEIVRALIRKVSEVRDDDGFQWQIGEEGEGDAISFPCSFPEATDDVARSCFSTLDAT
ncbi:hypothetical protein EW146_g3115 [Bondarzewia mesenterica]|uniref:Uncharacterized protein n=1 Tax=Bondarzewia mesenterica TaxID=1095465 RepID=A0A4S4LYI0_9AGAM|nr:hypothetical protein EW146_g3115 [Bondarzewia mesenterica]